MGIVLFGNFSGFFLLDFFYFFYLFLSSLNYLLNIITLLSNYFSLDVKLYMSFYISNKGFASVLKRFRNSLNFVPEVLINGIQSFNRATRRGNISSGSSVYRNR